MQEKNASGPLKEIHQEQYGKLLINQNLDISLH